METVYLPVTKRFETLEQWGYEVAEHGPGEYYIYYPLPEPSDRPHWAAYLVISEEGQGNKMVVKNIETEDHPLFRARASNLLLACWTGAGKHIGLLRRIHFETVVEKGMQNLVTPNVYNMMGLGLLSSSLSIRRRKPEHQHVFSYIMEHSRFALMALRILTREELVARSMEIVGFKFISYFDLVKNLPNTDLYDIKTIPYDFVVDFGRIR